MGAGSLRCSELDRVLSCPGSLTLVPRVAPRAGLEGAEGTALHFIAHKRMVDELKAIAPADFPEPVMPLTIRFSEWIANHYFNLVQDTVPADWSLQVECALDYQFPRFSLTGHIDCVAISPDGSEAIGFDLKTGYDPVDVAEQNWQIMGYACLLLLNYDGLRKVTFYICQPRNDEDEGNQRVSKVVVEGALLSAAPATLERHINTTLDQPMQLDSGKKQCRWCPVGLQCPALQKEQELMKHTLTVEEVERVKASPDDALLGDWIISMRTLRQPTEDAEELIKERLAANGYVDAGNGTRITVKTTGGSYTFPDKAAYYSALSEVCPDAAKRAKALKFSVTETRDLIAEVMQIPKTGKSAVTAQSVFDARFRPLVEQGERKVLQFSQ